MGIMSAIKEWWRGMFLSEVKDQFQVTGITSGDMQKAIQNWMLIYKGEPDWVDPEEGIKTIKFAKFVCGEIARLATLAIDVTFDGARKAYMTQFWEKSVHDRIREWTELMCACGTVILKPNGTGVDLVTPDRFEITSLDGNHNITGIVFQDSYQEGDEHYTKLEYHRFFTANVRMPDAEEYTSGLQPDVHITKKNGEQINSMLFGLYRMPSSNDIDLSSPLGLSAFADAIEELRDLDIAYSRNAEEIEDSRRMIMVDDRLVAKPAYKDEKAMQKCLDDLFYAQSVFADLYGLAPAGDYEPQYDFGDITYNEEEDRMRNLTLANSGYIPKWQYLVRFEGYSEEEAKAAVEEASGAQDKGLFGEE